MWKSTGEDGFHYRIESSYGIVLYAETKLEADTACSVLNRMEERAEFAGQCQQDQCENAYIEATIHKQLVRAASAAFLAFGSETEADAIHHLGQVLLRNVYSIIPEGFVNESVEVRRSRFSDVGNIVLPRENDDSGG